MKLAVLAAVVASLVLALGSRSTAAADSLSMRTRELVREHHAYDGRAIGFDLQTGYENPLGCLGVAIEVAPTGWLSLSAGAGVSIDGAQAGALARLRWIRDGLGVAVAGGVSMGPHEDRDIGWYDGEDTEWGNALYANAELAFYAPAGGGSEVRFSVGRRTMVWYSDCTGPECGEQVSPLYLGIGVITPLAF